MKRAVSGRLKLSQITSTCTYHSTRRRRRPHNLTTEGCYDACGPVDIQHEGCYEARGSVGRSTYSRSQTRSFAPTTMAVETVKLNANSTEKEDSIIPMRNVFAFAESVETEYQHAKEKYEASKEHAEHEAAKEKRDAFLLAVESHAQFHLTQSGALKARKKHLLKHGIVAVKIDENDDLYQENHSFSSSGKDLFDKYLGEFFGLKRTNDDPDYVSGAKWPCLSGNHFFVKKK